MARTHSGLVFVRRFQNALAKHRLIPRGSKIVVAISGGPDSTALLALLVRLREKHDFTLCAAHVNYQLRGRDSDRDEKFVQKLCEDWSVPVSIFRPKKYPHSNIEEQLRIIRYGRFEQLRKRLGFDCIVTAHNMNDVAETFLLNLLRGSGIVGLSPFQRAHSKIVRPLIYFDRTEIKNFLKAEKISSRTDRSNFSKRFTRNRIRHELLPLLETFNPKMVATLAKTAHVLNEKYKKAPLRD